MLYDGRGDYIRRQQPERVPLPKPGFVVWATVLLISAALLYASLKHGQPASMDESFKLVFSWG